MEYEKSLALILVRAFHGMAEIFPLYPTQTKKPLGLDLWGENGEAPKGNKAL